MKKVKIFFENSRSDLENAINEFAEIHEIDSVSLSVKERIHGLGYYFYCCVIYIVE